MLRFFKDVFDTDTKIEWGSRHARSKPLLQVSLCQDIRFWWCAQFHGLRMFDPTQLATICNHRLLGIVQAEKVMRRTHWAMPCSSCGQQLFFLTWSCWVALEPCRSIIEFHKASRIIDIKSIDTHSSPIPTPMMFKACCLTDGGATASGVW